MSIFLVQPCTLCTKITIRKITIHFLGTGSVVKNLANQPIRDGFESEDNKFRHLIATY